MKLVIISNKQPEELEKIVIDKFEGIVNKGRVINNSYSMLPLRENGIMVRYISSSRDIGLDLFFVLNESYSKI